MEQIKTNRNTILMPSGYNRRYTIDILLRQKAISEGKKIADVLQEILQKLDNAGPDVTMKKRMFYEYRKEKNNSTRPLLSPERLQIIADFFSVQIHDLTTTE